MDSRGSARQDPHGRGATHAAGRARPAFSCRESARPLPCRFVDAREDRLAKNEILFRNVNERIERAAAPHGWNAEVFEFLCECSNIDCTLHLRLTLADYRRVRSDSRLFVVAPGHELPEIEHVVERTDAYQIVLKEDEAAAIAADHDP